MRSPTGSSTTPVCRRFPNITTLHLRLVRPTGPKPRGRSERPYRYIRQDFFLARTFEDLEDLNRQFREWLDTVANRRRHGTMHRLIEAAYQAERPQLQYLPQLPFNTVIGAAACCQSHAVIASTCTADAAMTHYVGPDVSQSETSVCVVDETGRRVWQGKYPSTLDSIAAVSHCSNLFAYTRSAAIRV